MPSCPLVSLGPHDIDCGCVERGLDVRRVVFFDHFDTGAAVLGDWVDLGAPPAGGGRWF